MGRKHKRKTDKGLTPTATMMNAVKAVKEGESIRCVALKYGIAKSTLARYVAKHAKNEDCMMTPNYTYSMVFSENEEKQIADYLEKSSKMFHGLTPQQTRRMAYDIAIVNQTKIPQQWKQNKMAGPVWLTGFLERNPNLSIRQPEATSLARATSFNKHSVGLYFDLLKSVMTEYGITGRNIYNQDETGFTTVQRVPKVISTKGNKQVGQITSRERGELVTMCGIVSATGVAIPPVFVFPRKNMRLGLMQGAPGGSLGLVNESGWMSSELFLNVMEHFIKHANPGPECHAMLTMDNHKSHVDYNALKLAKDNNIHVVTLPPHTSHVTQPLDRSVYGPIKAYYNSALNAWMLQNPGRVITIYNVASLAGESWIKAASPANIISGFKACGVWPLDPNVFSDEDFMPSEICRNREPTSVSAQEDNTRPAHPCANLEQASFQVDSVSVSPGINSDTVVMSCPNLSFESPSTSNTGETTAGTPINSTNSSSFISPQLHFGYPKSSADKQARGRKRGRSIHATATPELKEIKDRSDLIKMKKQRISKKVKSKVRRKLLSSNEDGLVGGERSRKCQQNRDDGISEEEEHSKLDLHNVNHSEISLNTLVLVLLVVATR